MAAAVRVPLQIYTDYTPYFGELEPRGCGSEGLDWCFWAAKFRGVDLLFARRFCISLNLLLLFWLVFFSAWDFLPFLVGVVVVGFSHRLDGVSRSKMNIVCMRFRIFVYEFRSP